MNVNGEISSNWVEEICCQLVWLLVSKGTIDYAINDS